MLGGRRRRGWPRTGATGETEEDVPSRGCNTRKWLSGLCMMMMMIVPCDYHLSLAWYGHGLICSRRHKFGCDECESCHYCSASSDDVPHAIWHCPDVARSLASHLPLSDLHVAAHLSTPDACFTLCEHIRQVLLFLQRSGVFQNQPPVCTLAIFGLALAEEASKEKSKTQEKRGLIDLGYGYGGNSLYSGGHGLYGAGAGYALGGLGGVAIGDSHVKSIVINKETAYAVPQPYPVKVPVAVPVDRPYPVHIEKHVPAPYPVKVPVAVPVDRPYPVHIEKQVPVPYPVEKPVPYPVKVPVAVPVEKHVPVPVPVEKHVPYPVKVPVAVPVDRPYPVHVPKPYPVTVEKHVPYPVEVKVPVPQPYPVHVPKPVAVPVEVPKPVPVPQPVYVKQAVPVYVKHHDYHHDSHDYSHGHY